MCFSFSEKTTNLSQLASLLPVDPQVSADPQASEDLQASPLAVADLPVSVADRRSIDFGRLAIAY